MEIGRLGPWRVERSGCVLEFGDEVALETTQQTLLVPAGERPPLRRVGEAYLRAPRGGSGRGAGGEVEVARADDEGVARQDEQHQGRRQPRLPHPHTFGIESGIHFSPALKELTGHNITLAAARMKAAASTREMTELPPRGLRIRQQ